MFFLNFKLSLFPFKFLFTVGSLFLKNDLLVYFYELFEFVKIIVQIFSENNLNLFQAKGKQLPSGVYNASACRFGAPIFMSQPHFYQADPYFAEQVKHIEILVIPISLVKT